MGVPVKAYDVHVNPQPPVQFYRLWRLVDYVQGNPVSLKLQETTRKQRGMWEWMHTRTRAACVICPFSLFISPPLLYLSLMQQLYRIANFVICEVAVSHSDHETIYGCKTGNAIFQILLRVETLRVLSPRGNVEETNRECR